MMRNKGLMTVLNKVSLSVVFLLFWLLLSSASLANTTTTSPTEPNLNTGTVTPPFGGCPAGTSPININNSTWGTSPDYAVRWGECVSTFEISVAINSALQASGISCR